MYGFIILLRRCSQLEYSFAFAFRGNCFVLISFVQVLHAVYSKEVKGNAWCSKFGRKKATFRLFATYMKATE